MRIRKTPSQNATELSIFYSVALGTPVISKLAALSTIIPSLYSATLPFPHRIQARRRQTNRNGPPQSAHSSLCQIPTTFLSFAKCVGISTSARDTLFHVAATWPFPAKQPCQTSVYALSRNPPTHFAYLLMPGVHPITFRAPSTPGNAVGSTRIRPWLTRFSICPLGKKRDNQPKKGAYHE